MTSYTNTSIFPRERVNVSQTSTKVKKTHVIAPLPCTNLNCIKNINMELCK
jgi:hypothetical protein